MYADEGLCLVDPNGSISNHLSKSNFVGTASNCLITNSTKYPLILRALWEPWLACVLFFRLSMRHWLIIF